MMLCDAGWGVYQFATTTIGAWHAKEVTVVGVVVLGM
jgi:hypothetical protein